MATNKPAPVHHKDISTNNYILLVVVVSVLVVIICGFIARSLTTKLILNTKVEVAKVKADQALSEKLDNIPQLIEAYNQLGSKKQLIEDGLPTSENFPQIVTIMESMSSSAGVKLQGVSPGDGTGIASAATVGGTGAASTTTTAAPIPTAGATPYTFTVDVSGPYARMQQFIKNMEKSVRPMSVETITMRGSNATVTANFKVTTYWQPAADTTDKKEAIK